MADKINCLKCSYCLPDNKGWCCGKTISYRRVRKHYVETKTRPIWCKRKKEEAGK